MCRDAVSSVNHNHRHVTFFDGLNGAHDGIKFEIFVNFGFFADSCRVNDDKILAKFVVLRVNRVARGAGNVRDDVALFTQQSVDERRFTDVWLSDDGNFGQIGFKRNVLFHFFNHRIQQLARSRTRH